MMSTIPTVSVAIRYINLINKIYVHNPDIGRELKYLIMLCRKYPPLKDDKCICGLAQHLRKVMVFFNSAAVVLW